MVVDYGQNLKKESFSGSGSIWMKWDYSEEIDYKIIDYIAL